ncbi:MAG: NADH-quinone oxidoreductase subunit L, partial [Acidimicrobiia bacterium]
MTSTLLLAVQEHTVAARHVSDGGVLADWAWLIVVVPLVAAALIAVIGSRLRYKGYELAVGSLAFAAVYGVVLFIANINQGIVFEDTVEVARVGTVTIEWGWVVDGLSILMYAVVGVVGFFVFVYSYGYMKGDIRYSAFFASFTLFAGSMLVLVSAPNLIQLLVGWELVGLCSYLLIGHYWEDHENSSAAIKAFLTNKIADVGLVIGVIVVSLAVGSFRIRDILEAAVGGDATLSTFAVTGGVLLFIGAMGKSAQFPFHVWLPDAMAGPTPVSSLMHAATMVTAGVYLIGRMFPFYETMASDVNTLILVVGTITLFATGLLALVQDDIKRVLAYSTLSQLGYMVAAMGAGAYTAGLFHLFTHAFFKSLLFLGAGAVIHGVHSNNMSDMGGLRKYMPRTFWTFVIGSLALAGIFPLAGFFSKDEILASLGDGGYTAALVVAIGGAFITAFYMARAVFLTFYGEYKGDGHPHEAPTSMTLPLISLAGLSAVAGLVNIPGVFTGFADWVGTRAFPIVEHHADSLNFGLAGLGLAAGLAGIWGGYILFFRDAPTQRQRDSFTIPLLYPLFRRKYYIDDLYMEGVIKPVRGPIAGFIDWTNSHIFDFAVNGAGWTAKLLARVVYGGIDQRGIDAAFNAAATGTGEAGGAVRHLQTGKVQQYAGAVFVG